MRLLEMLEHDDSYVYLTAVQALAALADADAVPVLDALIGQLHRFNPTTTTRWVTETPADEAPPAPPPVQRPPEVRLKVGEVLLKVGVTYFSVYSFVFLVGFFSFHSGLLGFLKLTEID